MPDDRAISTQDGVPIDAAHLVEAMPGRHRARARLRAELADPHGRRIATWLNEFGGVVTFDFRRDGGSVCLSGVGDQEICGVDVAVGYVRELGYQRIVPLGFSMGGSVVLRHAGLIGGVDAVVAISSPGQWYYRGTRPMRLLHLAVGKRPGRLLARTVLKTRNINDKRETEPLPPADAAAMIAPTPLLVVHGDQDAYFPVSHAQRIYSAAREPKELWIVPGFGHAERGAAPALISRIGTWIRSTVGLDATGATGQAGGNGQAHGPIAASPNAAA